MTVAGSPGRALVMRSGADSEMTSGIGGAESEVIKQAPGLLLVGWNHGWTPGSHTLVLAGRLAGRQTMTAPGTTQVLLQRDPNYLQPGFLRPGPNGRFTTENITALRTIRTMTGLGVEREHLRAVRAAADHEVVVLKSFSDPETVRELADLFTSLHTLLVKAGLRQS